MQQAQGLLVELEYYVVLAADDEQCWRLDGGKVIFAQVGPTAPGHHRPNRRRLAGYCQRGPGPVLAKK